MNTMTTRALRPRAMMMLCGLWSVALTAVPLHADQIAERDVIAAVETWVRYATADARPDAVIEELEPHTVEGVTTAYIAHLSGGGYCICGADTDLLPVYLYNPVALYDPANPGCRVVLQQIDRRLDRLRQARAQQDPKLEDYQTLLERRLDAWQDLIAGRVPPAGGRSAGRSDPDYGCGLCGDFDGASDELLEVARRRPRDGKLGLELPLALLSGLGAPGGRPRRIPRRTTLLVCRVSVCRGVLGWQHLLDRTQPE